MTFTIRKVSDANYVESIEIESLEALMEFVKQSEDNVIIYEDNTLLIYDDYME